MPTFIHNHIEFHFQDTGKGLPFVFQHGLGGDVSQPFGLFRPPPGVRLIAFDVRAHGRTKPMGDPSKLCFRTFGEDLAALVDHLGLGQFVVGGISMGAALALHFALRWPERAQGLVLSRPAWLEEPCPWNVKVFTTISRLIVKRGPAEGLEEFKRSPEYAEALLEWPDVANSLAQQFLNPGIEETAVKLERIIQDAPHPNRRQWSKVRVPTLVLGNDLDPIHPLRYAQELAAAIPGAVCRTITSKSTDLQQHGRDVQRLIGEFFALNFKPLPGS